MPNDFLQEPKLESPTSRLIEVKTKAKKFRWSLFAFILLCFLMPFVQVSCQGQKLMSFTGFQLALGTEIQEPQMFGTPKVRQISADILVLLSLMAVLVGLGSSFIKGKFGSLIPAICGAIGLLSMLIFKVRLDNEVLKQGGGLLNIEYLFGFISTCFLFLASAVLNGYFFHEEKTGLTPQAVPANTTEQPDKFELSSAGLTRQVDQWFIKKDVLGWVRRRAFLLSAIGGVVVALFIVYYAFIKPDPSADGKKAAAAYIDCQTAYKTKVDSVYETFSKEFAVQGYQTRADAERKLESLLAGNRQVYSTCNEAADILYKELMSRYRDDPEEVAAFSQAFNENNNGSKSADEIEQSSSLFAKTNEKLLSIRAPFPDSSRITKDLLGQSMDGWNFAYASEFKDVKIATQKPDGDMLILRTHLNLEDNVTKEQYFAVLDLKYNLNSNGEWDYDGFTQLLHDKTDVDYFINNELFLVGKWRWQGNYATYNPNGTWFGEHDNGANMRGTWRIVKGNLVLTFNGQNWLNKKIVQFSKNELVIDENSPARAERVE